MLLRSSSASIGSGSPRAAQPYLRVGARGGSSSRWRSGTAQRAHTAQPWSLRCSLRSSVRARVAAERVVEAPVAEQLAEQQGAEDRFVWTQCWWPVMTLDGLDPKVPRHVDLLGKSLVVWADSKGAWHCFEDVCPHRLAPLSEGRVEGDSLMCSYHGWTFNSQGACDSIPQIPAGPARAKACSDRKACARAYPTAAAKGLLWVWPEAGPQAAQQAERTPVAENVDFEGRTPWYRREMANRALTQLENIIDASHVPFAHHGAQGSRYNPMTHLLWSDPSISPLTKDAGFTTTWTSQAWGTQSSTFEPPHSILYNVHLPGKTAITVIRVMVVPTRPGYCVAYSNLPARSYLPEPFKSLALRGLLPAWVNAAHEHVCKRGEVVDGDVYMLHAAERLQPLEQGVGRRALTDCYVPGKVDAGVIAFREWLSRFGGEVPTCTPADAALEPPLMSKEQVLDRYHTHTKDCVHCKRALATIDTLQPLASALSALSAFVAVAAALLAAVLPKLTVSGAPGTQVAAGWWQAVQQAGLVPAFGAGLVLALVCQQVHKALGRWRQAFFYEEYVHALRD